MFIPHKSTERQTSNSLATNFSNRDLKIGSDSQPFLKFNQKIGRFEIVSGLVLGGGARAVFLGRKA